MLVKAMLVFLTMEYRACYSFMLMIHKWYANNALWSCWKPGDANKTIPYCAADDMLTIMLMIC